MKKINHFIKHLILSLLLFGIGTISYSQNGTWEKEGNISISQDVLARGESGYVEFYPLELCAVGMMTISSSNEGEELTNGFLVQDNQIMILSYGKVIGVYGEVETPLPKLKIEVEGATLLYYTNNELLAEVTFENNDDLVVHAYNFEDARPTEGIGEDWAEAKIFLSYAVAGIPLGCNYPNNALDANMNWTQTIIYDGSGENDCSILTEKRVYFDNKGRPIQTQERDKIEQKVWAKETLYDGFGRAVISTLPAPTDKVYIEYKSDFFLNTNTTPNSNQHYNWQDDFDKGFENYVTNNGLRTQTGGVDAPRPVRNVNNKQSGENLYGTLGWYYSTENTEEPNIAITDYPYARTEYSLLTGAARKTASPGNYHRMGVGHENAFYSMQVSDLHELYYLYGFGDHPMNLVYKYDSDDDDILGVYDYKGTAAISTYTGTMKNKIVKTIGVDSDGKQGVVFTDLDGNELASCSSGQVNGTDVQTQRVSAIIPIGTYRDIHIPDGCQGFGKIGASSYLQGDCVGGTGNIDFEIYDLETDELLTITDVTNLPSGFYRLSNIGDICIRLNYTLNYYDFSLNVYNGIKQLIATVPPNGVDYSFTPTLKNIIWTKHIDDLGVGKAGYVTNNIQHTQLILTKYNSLGQIAWTQSPDAGRTYFFYAKDGKLRFSQNAKQRALGKTQSGGGFSYMNYDRSGRVIETGEYKIPTNLTPLQTYYFPNEMPDFPQSTDIDVSTLVDNGAFSDPFCENKTHNQYDSEAIGSGRTQRFLMGQVAKTWNDVGTTWYSYDSEGRMEWEGHQIAGLSGIKFTDYSYDLLGNVTKIEYQKTQTDGFTHHYTYNTGGQLLAVETEDAQGHREKQADYTYYQDGSIKKVNLADGLQEMDYRYTIHGWLKSINGDEMNTSTVTNNSKIFSMSLEYYIDDYAPANGNYTPIHGSSLNSASYSGNVSVWRWKSNTQNLNVSSGYFAYQYQYNHRNELKEAEFGTMTLMGGTPTSYFSFNASTDYKVSNLQYDQNGNITHLDRNAHASGAAGANMDRLQYYYKAGTNQLDYIADVGLQGDYEDLVSQTANNYLYDEIGQLIEDVSNNQKIEYDVYGKVTAVIEVVQGPGKDVEDVVRVRYYYDASGMRVKKEAFNQQGLHQKTTYYTYAAAGVMSIYEKENGTTQQTELPIYGSGRIGIAYVGVVPNALDYHYELTDHLGNVRAVISKELQGSAITIKVESYSDYYPFGWQLPGRQEFSSNAYRYAYQGQEKDPETGWEAFELRMYDGRVGRWMTTDPYGQYFSPYLAMGNNPVNGVDPDGGFWHIVAGGFIGGVIGGVTSSMAGEGFWKGAVAGAVSGAAMAAFPVGFSALGAPIAGGLGGGIENGITQLWEMHIDGSREKFDPGLMAIHMAVGVAGGMITNGIAVKAGYVGKFDIYVANGLRTLMDRGKAILKKRYEKWLQKSLYSLNPGLYQNKYPVAQWVYKYLGDNKDEELIAKLMNKHGSPDKKLRRIGNQLKRLKSKHNANKIGDHEFEMKRTDLREKLLKYIRTDNGNSLN